MSTGIRFQKAMERLARSSWGKQGIGKCPNATVRKALTLAGFARKVKGEADDIMALTLSGFRALEHMRWQR
jgi:hypothetical protein